MSKNLLTAFNLFVNYQIYFLTLLTLHVISIDLIDHIDMNKKIKTSYAIYLEALNIFHLMACRTDVSGMNKYVLIMTSRLDFYSLRHTQIYYHLSFN